MEVRGTQRGVGEAERHREDSRVESRGERQERGVGRHGESKGERRQEEGQQGRQLVRGERWDNVKGGERALLASG